MSMIPECPPLVNYLELICKAPTRWYSALGYSQDSVHPGSVLLVYSVPVDHGARIGHLVVHLNLKSYTHDQFLSLSLTYIYIYIYICVRACVYLCF